MTKPVVVDPLAEAEINDTVALSASIGSAVVTKLRQAIQDLWSLLAANPGLGAKIPRTTLRQFPMTSYPYSVVYREELDQIVVYVFAHAYRRPGYWKKRLRNP